MKRDLRAFIEEEAASEPGLEQAAQRLSLAYRERMGRGERVVLKDIDALAYASARMPATQDAVARALALTLPALPRQPQTLLDCGAGTGAATLACCEALPIRNAICLEREPAMRSLGQRLTAQAEIPAVWNAFDVTEDAPLPKADLVIESYMLGELPEARLLPAALRLFEAAEQALLVIEPGTTKGFENLQKVKEALLKAGAHVAAPCPGDCCMLPAGDWCHFATRVERTRLMKRLKGGDAPFEDEKFCFLALTRETPKPCRARVLRHPQVQPGRIALTLCTQEGVAERTVTKKDPLWKRTRKAQWGDAFCSEGEARVLEGGAQGV